MKPSPGRLAALSLVLLAGGARAAAPETVTIAYKPTAAAVQYWVHSIERESRHALGASPQWHLVEGLALVHQAMQEAPEGKLSVAISSQARALAVEKKIVPTKMGAGVQTLAYAMTRRGEQTDPAAQKELTALVSPVFPAGPVPVGHTWKVQVPASEKFRLPLDVSHTVESIKSFKGARCAVIRTTVRAKGADPKAGCLVDVQIDGHGAFDLDAGNWLKNRTSISLVVAFAKPQPGGWQMLGRTVVRTVERRGPGDEKPSFEK